MTDYRDADPHTEYRRQAAEHFGRYQPPAASYEPPLPRIHRAPESPTSSTAPAQIEDDTQQLPPVEPGRTARLPRPSAQRFAAGTTYPGSGHARPVQPPMTTPYVPPPRSPSPAPRVAPSSRGMDVRPPNPYPAGAPTPQPFPSLASLPPVNVPHQSDTSAAPGFNLQPEHALWILVGFSVIASLMSGMGWLLIGAGCVAGAWYARTRSLTWPPDIEDLLVRARLTQPSPVPRAKPAVSQGLSSAPPAGVNTTPLIPFRPMTLGELFGGAVKIVVKYWTTLMGIPLVLLVACMAVFTVVALIAMQMMMTGLSSVDDGGTLFTGMIAMYVVLAILVYVVAFPADALLIALSVIATDKAVRGERVRLGEVFQLARRRMFAVCRLTLTFYTMFIVSDILIYALVFMALFAAPALAMVLMFALGAANFVIGILFSLSPIVVVVEGRGVFDSLKRSMQLTKSAWGRLLGVHLLWAVCVTPLLIVPWFSYLALGIVGFIVFTAVAFAALIAYVRTLQVLIYTDLRMRQESYETELLADWTRNTASH